MRYIEINCKVIQKGRKTYPCAWCDTLIDKGEKHHYRVYEYERDFQVDRMHVECFKAMEETPYDLISEGFIPGEQGRGEKLK